MKAEDFEQWQVVYRANSRMIVACRVIGTPSEVGYNFDSNEYHSSFKNNLWYREISCSVDMVNTVSLYRCDDFNDFYLTLEEALGAMNTKHMIARDDEGKARNKSISSEISKFKEDLKRLGV